MYVRIYPCEYEELLYQLILAYESFKYCHLFLLILLFKPCNYINYIHNAAYDLHACG
jgi:hypothetical protein